LPLDFHLTGAEASDSPQFETLLDLDPAVTPRAVIADKGYDATANRQVSRITLLDGLLIAEFDGLPTFASGGSVERLGSGSGKWPGRGTAMSLQRSGYR
jgi:hypothetical protein